MSQYKDQLLYMYFWKWVKFVKTYFFSSDAQNIIYDLQDGAEQYLCN